MARTDQRSIPMALIAVVIALVAARVGSSIVKATHADLVRWIPLTAIGTTTEPVLLYFPGSDTRIEEEVFRDEALARDINERFAPVRVEDERLRAQFHVRAVPAILIVDRSGAERARMEGFRSREELEKVLESVR